MATVRAAKQSGDIVVAAGWGARNALDTVRQIAAAFNADMMASRKIVDHGLLPYSMQVGLTGKSICPPVYLAIGISGALQHIAGMRRAGTVIAINSDKNAPIFDYADYGIICDVQDIQAHL